MVQRAKLLVDKAFGVADSTGVVGFAIGYTVIEYCWRIACVKASEGYRILGVNEKGEEAFRVEESTSTLGLGV